MTSLMAYDLRTEHRETPLGIDIREPRFSWRLRSAEPGQARREGEQGVEVGGHPASLPDRTGHPGWRGPTCS